ncbi:MAG: DUF2892 domain-containing protein [Propionibacterium sp.]|nr:DUF2892 domain-containing protein [Propionibacterium sp.]
MTVNVGNIDRISRLVAAVVAVVVALAIGISSVGGIVLLIVGLVLAATALVKFCPIYRLFGISTCPTK